MDCAPREPRCSNAGTADEPAIPVPLHPSRRETPWARPHRFRTSWHALPSSPRHRISHQPVCRMTAMTGGVLMSVALSQHQLSKSSISRALPWAGMGLCLAVLLGHVAYDVLARAPSLATATSDAA